MFFKKIFAVCIISVLGLTACAVTAKSHSTVDKPISFALEELFNAYPAQDNLSQHLLDKEILNHGPEGVLEICRYLSSGDTLVRTKACFAINGLSHYVLKYAKEEQRLSFVNALLTALKQQNNVINKVFLLEQLENCAQDEAVEPLSQFLTQEKLCAPTVRTMVAIGGEKSGRVLLKAMDQKNEKNLVHIVQALGQLEYIPACTAVFKLTDHKNDLLKNAALHALANLGYAPVEAKLKAETANGGDVDDLMLLAEKSKNKANGILICREILGDSGKYSDAARIQAFRTLADLDKNQAIDVLPGLVQENSKIRNAVLNIAEQQKLDVSFDVLKKQYVDGSSAVKIDIIRFWARQNQKQAMPLILEATALQDPNLCLEALKAISFIDQKQVIAPVFNVLKNENSKELKESASLILFTIPFETYRETLYKEYLGLSDDCKITALELIGNVQDAGFFQIISQDAASDNKKLSSEVLKLYADFGSQKEYDLLYEKLANDQLKNSAANTFVSMYNRLENKKENFAKLEKAFQESENKKIYYRIFKGIGDNKSLELVKGEIKSDKDQVVRTLANWPNDNALETLIDLAAKGKDKTHKILIFRGAVRLLRETPMGQPRAFEYCKQLMEIADRPEEKRLVLSELSNIESPQSLEYLVQFFDDHDLDYDAVFAATKIAGISEDQQENLSPEQVVLSLVKANASKSLQTKLAEQPMLRDELNQPPDGFTALFNGKDLAGWKGLVENPIKRAGMTPDELAKAQKQADDFMRDHWSVVDGVICFDGHGHSLCTEKDYRNFEMLVDWKIEKFGDSGIYLRGAPQVQIWDTAQWPEGSGGLYNNKINPSKPLAVADNPIGDWNTFRIIMKDERVTVFLNDVLVVDNVIMENYWERDKPIYPVGQIELQSHHSPLYFRNIFIKELPADEPAFSGPLFNGKDLTGWESVNNSQGWNVKDGILYTEGTGGGWISTTREYDNFKLDLEFRVPPDGNSGVFIRAPHKGDPAYTGMEIQVLDDYAEKYKNLKPYQYTGSIYAVQAPDKRVTKKAGEWQKMSITCNGPQVTVVVNGIQTVDTNIINYLDQEKEHPGLKRRKGFIGFQNHHTKIEYRNIYLKELR